MFAVRKAIVAGVALAAAVGLSMVGAAPAAAGTVKVPFGCGSVGGPFVGDFLITIDPPATAAVGQPVTVKAAIGPSGTSTIDVPAGYWNVTMNIRLGGAASDAIKATGLTNPPLKAGDLWIVKDGTAKVTFTAAGEVTYRVTGFFTNRGWGCAVNGPEPVVATTRVS